MPQETGYRQQVAPGAPVNLPDASPAAFGAGVGRGIEQVGAALQTADMRHRQLERQQTADSEAADAAVKLAAARQQLDAARDQARATPSAGAADHVKTMEAAFDATTAGIADGITDNRVRRSVTTQLADYRSSFVSGESSWQTIYTAKKSATDMGVVADQGSARLATSSDPAAYAQETKAFDDALDAAPGFGADAREAFRRQGHAQLAIAQAGRMERDNPAGLIVALKAGVFNDVLDGKQIDHLLDGADAKQRMLAAQARAAQAAELTKTREALATKRAELDTGAGTPQDWGTLAAQYEAIGDTSSAVTARAAGMAQKAALDHRGDALPQLDTQIASLTAKQSQGGLSPAEASLRTGLVQLRQQKSERLGQQGGALLEMQFATGESIVPLNPSDPQAMRARAAQARRAAQLAGRATIEPFTEAELPGMKDLMEKGAGGRIQVLQTLSGLHDAQAIDGAARQVAGSGDGAFRIAGRMLTYPAGMAVAQAIVRGDEIRSKQPWQAKDAKTARADFDKYYGNTLKGGDLPPDYINDLFEGASAFYASRTNGAVYNAGRFAEATEAVLGRNGGRGGIARLPGVGNVVAPPTMTPDAMMARFARAKGPDYNAAAGGRHPVYSDGTALTRPQIRAMLPTLLADGRYGFRGTNGALVHDDRGGIYAVDLMKLPAR